jgi:hypothetical protein
VVIGPDIEFGYADTDNTDTADFTGTTLTLTDVSLGNSLKVTYIFTDPAFTSLSLISSSFTAGLTSSLSGDVLTITTAELGSPVTSAPPGTYSAEFAVGSVTPTTPEPGSFALLGTGILGLCGLVRRRMKA